MKCEALNKQTKNNIRMKNFTNSFKQFTSRLSARWLIMALMLLVGTSSAWGKTLYVYSSNSSSYAWIWNKSNSSNFTGGAWPGAKLNNTSYFTALGNNWYKFKTNITVEYGLILSGGASNGQTSDIYINDDIYCIKHNGGNSFETYGTPSGCKIKNSWGSDINFASFSEEKQAYTMNSIELAAGTYTMQVYKGSSKYWSSFDNSRGSGVTLSGGGEGGFSFTLASAMNVTFFYDPGADKAFAVGVSACTPATSITSATLEDDGTISLVGNFTTCGAKHHGFQWRKSTAEWCNDGDETQDFSNYVKIGNTEGSEGEEKVFTPTQGNTYVFRTYIYNNGEWIYSTEIKEVSTCVTVNAPNVTADAICAGSTATLTLNNPQDGVTYRLNNATTGDIIFSTGNTYTTPTLNGNTTYTIYASHEDACDGTNNVSDEVTVTINAIPATPNVITTATVCPNTSVTLSSYNNGVANVLWYTNSNCSQSASATVSIDAETRYYARVKNGNCYSETASLTLSVYEAPADPALSPSGKINVGQNKSTTITVSNMDANATYACYNANDQEVGTWNGNSVTFNVGDATGEFTYSIVATHGTCADLSTPTEFTVKVEEAGVKIAALGSTALYENDPTHFIPMYVSNEDLAGVDATSVTNYTWQFSANGTSGWEDCTRSYSNFNAANNQSNSNVVVDNGSGNCNNWRANQVGYYRCQLTYNNDKKQVSGNIQVTGTNNNKTNKQHIGITYNLPIISVNTGATDFPSDANLATISSNCGSSKYPSIHADDLKKKRSVDVMMFNPNGTICYDRKARMNYRGSSSLNFKKKSYAFCPGKEKCGDDEKGADYVKTNKENLFGLSNGAADKDWVLYAATPDPSMMRNRLVFDLYKKMRPDEWGVNSMYVELVVNGEYRGVYVLMDKITNNENRVNIKNANGFIVKFDKTDVVDRVENTEGDQKTFATSRTGTKNSSNGNESYGTCIDQRFEIEYPEKEDIQLWDAFYGNVQQRFEDFETALANKDYATVRTLIDYNSWADWFIITELAKNQDGYRASCIFVYDGDKIEARPLWDQELSFNNGTRVKHGIDDPEGLLIKTSSVYGDAFYPPFWFIGHTDKNNSSNITGGLLNDPCFVSLVKQKWATYQSGVCSAASIGNMVADYNTELGDAINREAARWPYTEEVRGTTTDGDYVGYYSQGEGNPSQYSYAASKAAITAWASDRSTALTAGSGLGEAINDLNGEALIFTISPSSVETTPWKQVLLTVNAPEGYEYTFDDSSINNATVRASVKKDNNTYAIKIPRPTAWGIGGNGDPNTQTQYQVSATIEVSGENQCGTIQNGTATSTITLTDVTEDCNPEIVKP